MKKSLALISALAVALMVSGDAQAKGGMGKGHAMHGYGMNSRAETGFATSTAGRRNFDENPPYGWSQGRKRGWLCNNDGTVCKPPGWTKHNRTQPWR